MIGVSNWGRNRGASVVKTPNKIKRNEVNLEPNLTLRIESLAFGGDGVGRVDGKVCFVPYSAPGDLLSVRVVEDRGSFLRAEIVEVREPGPARRTPRCSHFGECGGCSWQHIDYAAQLDAKRAILAETLEKIAGLRAPVRPVVASAQEYGYRTRARLHAVGARLGYFERLSNRIVAVSECPILAPQLESRLKQVTLLAGRKDGRLASGPRRPPVSTVELELDGPGRVDERRSVPSGGPSRGPRRERSESDEYAFHQVNRFVNSELIELVSQAVTGYAAGRPIEIVDLFCGNGNLSLPLAAEASSLHGFDTSEESIRLAAQSARSRGFDHAHYACMEAAHGLERVSAEHAAAQRAPRPQGELLCIIADPPRSGMKGLAAGILALAPELLVYVSCNPPALARDARMLVDGGMELDHLQPLDMFPQTYHLETVAVFTRPRQ